MTLVLPSILIHYYFIVLPLTYSNWTSVFKKIKSTFAMLISRFSSLFSFAIVTAALRVQKPSSGPLSLKMLDSIILREQGVTVNASVKTGIIEGALLLLGISELLENIPLNCTQKTSYNSYFELVMSGLANSLMNVTVDVTSPLDEFSVGTELIKQ
jgi:hypothetical protein